MFSKSQGLLVTIDQISKGASYVHHYCTVALCCPSRVNLWTGRAAHNTNVTDLAPPYGKRADILVDSRADSRRWV